jgi:hypothetical protein
MSRLPMPLISAYSPTPPPSLPRRPQPKRGSTVAEFQLSPTGATRRDQFKRPGTGSRPRHVLALARIGSCLRGKDGAGGVRAAQNACPKKSYPRALNLRHTLPIPPTQGSLAGGVRERGRVAGCAWTTHVRVNSNAPRSHLGASPRQPYFKAGRFCEKSCAGRSLTAHIN